jgi:predicted dehydrogenase
VSDHDRVGLVRARMVWSVVYRPDWDDEPDAYVVAGIVAHGRSRRLGRAAWPGHGVLVYLGIQHLDPARWGVAGDPTARFFVSLRHGPRVWLRTYPTVTTALAAVAAALPADP